MKGKPVKHQTDKRNAVWVGLFELNPIPDKIFFGLVGYLKQFEGQY